MLLPIPTWFRTTLLILLAAFLAIPEAEATHLLGGDLTYTYLGQVGPAARPYRYRVTLKAYVDGTPPSNFFQGNLGNNATLEVFNGTTNTRLQSISIPSQPGSTITQRVQIPVANGCTVSISDTAIRIFLNTFTTEIDLPFSLQGYKLIYSGFARSSQIQNLALTGGNNPTEGNSFVAFIPSPLIPNSSPQFFDNATTFICRSDTVTLANSARDPDGDRLIYEFVKPLDGVNTGATWVNPSSISYDSSRGYTLAQPFGPGGIAEINSASGFTRYHAPSVGAYVIAFQIKEFRTLSSGRDSLISTTRREVQILVRDCLPNNPPVTNGGSPTLPPTTDYTITEGESLTFNVGSTDSDTMTISATADIIDGTGGYTGPLATFPSVTGKNTISSTFTWHTTCGVRGTFPVNVKVVDKGCPPKTTNAVYLVTVRKFEAPKVLSAGNDSVCGTGQAYTYSVTSSAPDNQFKWVATGGTIQGSATGKTVSVVWTPTGSITSAFLRVIQTSAIGSCKDSTTFTVRVFPLFPVSITPAAKDLCEGDTASLVATGGFGTFTWSDIGGGPPRQLSSSTGATVQTFTDSSRRYVVTSINVAGCPVKDTIAVRFVPDVARAGSDSALCSNLSILIGSDSVTGYGYAWTPVNNLSTPGQSHTVVTPVNGSQIDTVYRYVQTATERLSGCVSTDTVDVLVRPLPIVNAGPDTATFCSSFSIDLPGTASFPSRFKWTVGTGTFTIVPPTDTTDTASVTGFTASHFDVIRGLVRLTATDKAHGCIGRDSINIRINPLPAVVFNPRDSACAGQILTLGDSAFSGYLYGWQINGGLTLSDSNAAMPSVGYPVQFGDTATFFTAQVRIVNQYGCRKDSSQIVRRNNLPRANAGADLSFCSGDSVTVGTLSNPRYAYLWQNTPGFNMLNIAQPRYSATNTPAGSADRFITLGLLATNTKTTCQATDSVRLRVYSRPVVQAALTDTVILCNKDSIQLGVPARGAQSYQWMIVLPSGTSPEVTLGPVNASQPMFGATGWANNSNQPYFETLLLTATNDTTNCAATDTLTARVNPTPMLYPVVSDDIYPFVDSICSGSAGRIFHLQELSDTLMMAHWTAGTGFNTGDTASFTPGYQLTLPAPGAPAEEYRYPVKITYSGTGCADTASVKIVVKPVPVITAGSDLITCSLAPIQIGVAGQPGRAYAWYPNVGLSDSGQAQPTFTFDNPTQHDSVRTIIVKASDTSTLLRCSNTDTLQVTVRPLPIADAGSDTAAVCSGSNLQLGIDSTAGYAYQWTPGQGLSSDTVSNPVLSLTGTNIAHPIYKVTVTNRATGCHKADSIMVRLNPLPLVNLGTINTVCAKSPASLGVFAADSGRFTYAWTPRAGLTDTARSRTTFESDTAGTYQIVLNVQETYTSCRNADTLTLTVNPLPVANAGLDTSYCADGSIQIGSAPDAGNTYAWTSSATGTTFGTPTASSTTFSLPNATPDPIIATAYVTVTIAATNCKSVDSVKVTTNPRPDDAVLAPSPGVVCPGTTGEPYQVNAPANTYTYTWTIGGTGTLTSGQGTGAILVGWGASSPTNPVSVVATNSYGCAQRGITTFNVTVNDILHPQMPLAASGLSQLCRNQAHDTYSTVTSPNSTYTWRYEISGQSQTINNAGQSINVNWDTTGLAIIWVEQITTPPSSTQCFGRSDSLLVRINASPDTALNILGQASVCEFGQGVYSLAGLDSSSYAWTIAGPNSTTLPFTGQGDSAISVIYTPPGNYTITTFETSNHNCPGKLRTLDMVVNPKPPIGLLNAPTVCSNDGPVSFSVIADPNPATYTWFVDAPATIDNNGQPTVNINPNGSPITGLRVMELSAAGCSSDTAAVPFNFDGSKVELLSVSTKPDDDTRVVIRLRVSNNSLQSESTQLMHADNFGGFSVVQTFAPTADGTVQEFEDASPNATATEINRYQVSLTNKCNQQLTSAEHATMVLAATADQANSLANLSWNAYQGFNGVTEYEILRSLDGGAASFTPLGTAAASGAALTSAQKVGQDGFDQYFRVKVTDPTTGEVSYSNIAKLNFTNALVFYNVVTPNGDGKNDFIYFENLELYPNNTLKVYNQWGRLVNSITNYKGDFAPDQPGTYLFEFTTDGGVKQRGWIEVTNK